MKLSTTTSSLFSTFGEEEGIKIAKEVGFDALDMNLITANVDYYDEKCGSKNAERLKNLAEKNGLCFNQAHAPFPTMKFINRDVFSPDTLYNQAVKTRIANAIRFAGLLGADQIVIHPVDFLGRSDQKERNIEIYNAFAPIAEASNIKIALENMWGRCIETGRIVPNVCSVGDELGEYYEALDPNRFCVCLDLGHTQLIGQSAEKAITALGHNRLHALHVHDNNGVADEHAIPYFGVINWDAVAKALADIDYRGDFTFEANGDAFIRLEKEPKLAYHAYKLLAQTGRNLIEKIENYKEN